MDIEILEHDYDWFINEGKIISDDYIKYILTRENKDKPIDEIIKMIKEIFNIEDLKRYYILTVCDDNILNYICRVNHDLLTVSKNEYIHNIYSKQRNDTNNNILLFNDINELYKWLYKTLPRYMLSYSNHLRGIERLLKIIKEE
jgi:hypothetical protein